MGAAVTYGELRMQLSITLSSSAKAETRSQAVPQQALTTHMRRKRALTTLHSQENCSERVLEEDLTSLTSLPLLSSDTRRKSNNDTKCQ